MENKCPNCYGTGLIMRHGMGTMPDVRKCRKCKGSGKNVKK